ncbi:MAG: MFS transporter [Clostridiales bacterium]|nr:MFS transporter [Clostridiales bacterium]
MSEKNQDVLLENSNKSEFAVHDRRYVNNRETFAYLLNDMSNVFNIDAYKDRFIWDVVKIDFNVNAVVSLFTGAWDVINDPIIGTVVDKTRTRWGKFRPYMLFFQIPLTIIGTLYWFMPYIFPNTVGTYLPKLIFYFAFSAITETAGTFTSVAKTGYMTTITPHPNDRARLITMAELLTGYMGEDLPGVIMGLLIDLINNKILPIKLRTAFLGMGLFTNIMSCFFTFYFFMVSRERVPQTLETPSVKQGIKAVFNNYPILLITLSDFLGGFSISTSTKNYFIDVLGAASLETILNIPSSMIGSISYAFVKPMRKRFSSKALWVGEDLYTRFWWILLWAIGSVNKNYQRRLFMCVAFGIQAFFDKWAFGVRKVVKAELYNEAMDYCEWKNGYRMEATIGVARNLIVKVQTVLKNSIQNVMLAQIGYIQGKTIGTQKDSTKWWLFAMCTGIPQITGILAVIPKFLYPLSREKREQMYNDLLARRHENYETILSSESTEND